MQVPLFLRKFVSSYAAIPDNTGAYTAGGHITLFGAMDTDVFIHESTHAYDGGNVISGNELSSQPAYLKALAADTCSPDEYANVNNVECFAQDMVVFLYQLWNPRTFYRDPCMAGQMAYMNSSTLPGMQDYVKAVGETASLTVSGCSSYHRLHAKASLLASTLPGRQGYARSVAECVGLSTHCSASCLPACVVHCLHSEVTCTAVRLARRCAGLPCRVCCPAGKTSHLLCQCSALSQGNATLMQ